MMNPQVELSLLRDNESPITAGDIRLQKVSGEDKVRIRIGTRVVEVNSSDLKKAINFIVE